MVEVLSKSTEHRDWRTKLPNYKKIPSVEYILFVEQYEPFVSYFKRKGNTNVWENIDYDELDQSFQIEGNSFSLTELYKKILFS